MIATQGGLLVVTILELMFAANASMSWPAWSTDPPVLLYPTAGAVDAEPVVPAVDCDDVSACGIQDEDDCLWRVFQQRCVDDFDSLDPVEQRLCELNVVLDGELTEFGEGEEECWYDVGAFPPFSGNESFFRGDPAVGHIDRVFALDFDPGPNGIDEPPLAWQLPSGFNIGCSVLWFEPDHDATDEEDSSFLYVAWDIADPDGLVTPVPYDADGNGSACVSDEPGVVDVDEEFYKVNLRGCADLTVYHPQKRVTNDLSDAPDVVVEMSLEELAGQIRPLDTFVTGLETWAFPTANGVTNQGNACIDNERIFCANGNNVEMVIKAVETCGYFGPNTGFVCSVSESPCEVDDDCPAGETCGPIKPDLRRARENRIALAQLVALLRADSDGDDSPEESAVVALRTSIPDIEVTKFVRCADTEDPFVESLDALPAPKAPPPPEEALPDTEVEFEITITNYGNEDLAVTVTDVMEAIGTQAGVVTFEPVCETLEAKLTSPRRGLANHPVTHLNADQPPICDEETDPDCLNTAFFYPSCVPPPGPVSFLEAVSTGGSSLMGTLLGAVAGRTDGVCEVTLGDYIILRFRAVVGADEGFCDAWDDPDFRNGVTVTGTLVGESEIIAEDEPDVIDTDREERDGEDDNVVTVDLLCNGLECAKGVCADLNNDGDCNDAGDLGFTSDLALPCDVTFPIQLIHRIETCNTGETRLENVNVYDDGDCQSCSPLNLDECCVVEFVVPVPDRAAWDALATGDGDADPDCYTNEGIATGEVDTSGICAPDGTIGVESLPCTARTCMGDCSIKVEKGFRCIKSCADRTPVGNPTFQESLDATPSTTAESKTTVQFEIGATNEGDESICALRYTDILTGSFDPCPEPEPEPFCTVRLNGAVCTVPGDWFKTDGTPFELILVEACGVLMAPGDRVEIRCAGTIPEGASGQVVNIVDVECAPDDGDNCVTGAVYCRGESAEATVDIKPCSMDVTKDVTCDDPRDPGAVFEPDSVDALPGSTVGFRIRICNTGEVNLTSVDIDDDLVDCSAWFVPNSVVATINGDDVTDCVCTDPVGICDSIGDINGRKDLDPCPPGGIAPGECLIITFEVAVPEDFSQTGTAVDCVNTVRVDGFTDVCSPSGPCAQEGPVSARIDVKVPKITCVKQVCVDRNSDGDCDDEGEFGFTDELGLPCDLPFPFTLIHRVTVYNTGETPIDNVHVCDPPHGCQACGTLLPGASCSVEWSIPVPDRPAWEALAGSDNDGDPNCYVNVATARGTVDTTDLCDRNAETNVSTSCEAKVCLSPPCELDVTKGFRCIDNCEDRNPDEDPVFRPSLDVISGATVEFEIGATNEGDEAICALRFTDTLVGDFESCPEPFCTVQLINGADDPWCTVPPDWFKTDGTPFELMLVEACGVLMAPNDRVEVRCAGTIPEGASVDVTNGVTVKCAPTCPGGEPVYCGSDDATAQVIIKTCSFEVDKDGRCVGEGDDAWRDLVDALPGSEVEFRIQVCNTGEVNLTSVDIDDDLDCSAWFVPGSVTAKIINDDDATNCICTDPVGVCDSIGDLNGRKNLDPCHAGGIGPGECLTILFKVMVPANFAQKGTPVDCTNTVKVRGFPDICASPAGCGEEGPAIAQINVKVPEIECDKLVCLDSDDDGVCTVYSPSITIEEMDFDYPFSLFYRLTGTNGDETSLENVQLCDSWFGCHDCPPLAPGESCEITWSIRLDDEAALEALLASDDCFTNDASAGGNAGADAFCAPDGGIDVISYCSATVCIVIDDCDPGPCPPITKAKADIWNENEDYFSGSTRCVESWTQTLLSEYTGGGSNHFWRHVLQTDKGKARINGVRSTAVCGEESIDAPLLGVAAKVLHFNGGRGMSGMTLVGQGDETGQILYDVSGGPDDLHVGAENEGAPLSSRTKEPGRTIGQRTMNPDFGPKGSVTLPDPPTGRASTSQKGSFLVYPNVEIKWDRYGNVIQDTFVDITNDYPANVRVKLYFVDSDRCIWLDNVITLTNNEPTYWSVLTGEPKGVSPFTTFGAACPDDDPLNPGGRRLYGYVLAWAVDSVTGEEIKWNHLQGVALMVNYQKTYAWEYNAWAFQAVAGAAIGDPLLDPPGQLDLDGVEYDAAPAMLLLDFYASGAVLPPNVGIDTDLTLWAAIKDFSGTVALCGKYRMRHRQPA